MLGGKGYSQIPRSVSYNRSIGHRHRYTEFVPKLHLLHSTVARDPAQFLPPALSPEKLTFLRPVIVIPIRLLWRVQIKPRQKLGLGVSLCLSVMMMITALARLCGIRASNGAMDITWNSFWHLTEGCIAVTMASSTAFRTFFVAHRSHAQGNANNKPFPRGQEPWKRKVFGTGREINGSQDMTVLPEIPRATFTGMGTLFNGEETEFKGSPLGSDALAEKEDSWPLSWRTAAQRFGDQLCGSLESETVCPHTLLLKEMVVNRLTDHYEQTVTATPMGV